MSLWLLLDRVLDSLVTVVEIYKGLIRTCAASLGNHCLHLCRLLRTHKVPLSQQTSQKGDLNCQLDQPPSLFDRYEIHDGLEVFALRFDESTLRDGEQPGGLHAVADCHAFSNDDCLLAFGMHSGSILIYETHSGRLRWTLSRRHCCPIADVVFLSDAENRLLCVDEDGRCSEWDLIDEPRCLNDVDYLQKLSDLDWVSVESLLPRLSANGKFLAISLLDRSRATLSKSEWKIPSATNNSPQLRLRNKSSVPDSKHYLHVHLFALSETDQKFHGLNQSSQPALSVQMNRENACFNFLSNQVQFSPLSSRLVLTACDLVDVYLVLWPRITDTSISFKLKGNKAVFSADDQHLVTWTDPDLVDHNSSDDCVYIWDMSLLESTTPTSARRGWDHPRLHATDAVTLQEPGFGHVLACAFVRLQEGRGVAVCYAADDIQIVVWSMKALSAVHVIHNHLTSSSGPFDFSVSADGKWITLQAHAEQEIRTWSAEMGVEVMRLCPESIGESSGLSDLYFSKTSKYLLMIETQGALLWILMPLHPFNVHDRPFQSLKRLSERESTDARTICKFSLDGHSVGFLASPSSTLEIWNLDSQEHTTLDWKGILQAAGNEIATKHVSMDSQYQFCQFALSHDGSSVATCMADSTVLLWNLTESITCTALDKETTDCFPAKDLCFSVDAEGETTIVICQDHGDLIWLDPHRAEMIGTVSACGYRLCKFSANGETAVMMPDIFSVYVWDLVHRIQLHHYTYTMPMLNPFQLGAEVGLSPDGSFYLAGFDSCQKPFRSLPVGVSSHDSVGNMQWGVLCISDDGEWALTTKLNGEISKRQISDSAQSLTPPSIRRKKSLLMTLSRASRHSRNMPVKDLRLIHLSGRCPSKKIQLPCEIYPESLIILSADGHRCAAVTAANELVVWNAHMVDGTIIQEHLSIANAIRCDTRTPSDFLEMLQNHGSSLLNHPYENGMTLVALCVYHKNIEILKEMLCWAQRNDCKLALEGTIHIPESHTTADNVVELALSVNSPEITKVLFDSIIHGITTDNGAAHIFERSLMNAAALYPSLFTQLIDNPKLLKTICSVQVSQSCFQDGLHFITTTDNHLLPSSNYAAEKWKTLEEEELEKTSDRCGNQIDAEAAVVPIPDVAKISSGSCLHRLNLIHVHHSVYNSEFVRALVDIKYKLYARSLLSEDFYQLLSLLVCFTSFSASVVSSQETHVPVATAILAGVSAVLAFLQLVYYLKLFNKLLLLEGTTGVRFLTVQCMVWKTFFAFLLIIVVIPLCLYSNPNSQFFGPAVGFANLILWMRLAQYLETCETIGPLLVTLQEVIGDILWFLLLLLICIVGCGLSLFFLMNITPVALNEDSELNMLSVNLEEHDLYPESSWKGVLVTLMLMLGDVGNVFDIIMKKEQGFRLFAALMMVIFFLTLVAIVLVNVMIAMMGDSFDRVKNSENSLFTRRKARIIHLLEIGLSERRRNKINSRIATYLHVLKPQSHSHLRNDLWTGRLNEIQRGTRDEIQDMQRNFTRDVRNVEDRLQRIEHSLSFKISS